MPRIHVAFFVAAKGDCIDRALAWVSRGPYSHCELVLADGVSIFASPLKSAGHAQVHRDGYDCHYRLVPLDVTTDQYATILGRCRAIPHAPRRRTDHWPGFLKFLLLCEFKDRLTKRRERRWCSDWLADVLAAAGVIERVRGWIVTPTGLARAVERAANNRTA